MIRVSRHRDGVSLRVDDPTLADAVYVDADWIHQAGTAAALVVPEDGRADVTAARALVRVAKSAAAACGDAAVEVCGLGMVAAAVRSLVAREHVPADGRPGAIVEASGAAAAIGAACARVADLGVVVLAGEAPGGSIDLNLYPDVHVRGLVLVGVPSPDISADAGIDDDEPLVVECLDRLVVVAPGEVLPPAAWYRLR